MSIKIILDEDHIQSIVKQLAFKLSDMHFDVVLCTLSGAVPFFSDLIKHLEGDFEVDYIQAKSYKDMVQGSCVVRGPFGTTDLRNKKVLVVEDIIDTGKTVVEIEKWLNLFACESITFVALLKRQGTTLPSNCYGCIEVEPGWLYGYGLDDENGKKRNLPYIYVNI